MGSKRYAMIDNGAMYENRTIEILLLQCRKGNCFPKSLEQAHENHGCEGEIVQEVSGLMCETYTRLSLEDSFRRESTRRNQTAGQLRMSAMLRHEERTRRFFLGVGGRLLLARSRLQGLRIGRRLLDERGRLLFSHRGCRWHFRRWTIDRRSHNYSSTGGRLRRRRRPWSDTLDARAIGLSSRHRGPHARLEHGPLNL